LNALGLTHTTLAGLAILFGGVVVANRKGTSRHKAFGWLYVVSMIGQNVTALLIYRLFGRFGPFHWLALVSLATVMLALAFVLLRRPANWLALHGETMSWSFVGLLAAAVAEVSVRILSFPFGLTVLASSIAVTVVGGTITRLKMRRFQRFK
jgi:uncharacterized membrane protein